MLEQNIGIGGLEIIMRKLHLIAMKDIAVADATPVKIKLKAVIRALHIHGQTLQPIGQFACNKLTINAADLLEIGKLRHFHAVAPHFPAKPPSAQSRAFPIIFDKANIMRHRVNAQHLQTVEIKLLDIVGRGLQNHLELIIMLKAVRVLAIAPIGRAARGLHISGMPGLRPQCAQNGCRMKSAGPHFHIIGL